MDRDLFYVWRSRNVAHDFGLKPAMMEVERFEGFLRNDSFVCHA